MRRSCSALGEAGASEASSSVTSSEAVALAHRSRFTPSRDRAGAACARRRPVSISSASRHSTSSAISPPPASTRRTTPPGGSASGDEADGKQRGQRVRRYPWRTLRLFTPSTPSNESAERTRSNGPFSPACFPAEAVDQRGEAARLLVEADVADAQQRVLHGGADDVEVGCVLGHQFQHAAAHAASSSRCAHDLRAARRELGLQLLEAAIEVIDAVHRRFAFRGKAGDDEADRRAQDPSPSPARRSVSERPSPPLRCHARRSARRGARVRARA